MMRPFTYAHRLEKHPEHERHFLIPRGLNPEPVIPTIGPVGLQWLIGSLMAPERKALEEIVENGDILLIDGYAYLLAPVCPETVDILAAFGAEAEDRENDLCDEESEDREDDKSDTELNGNEVDFRGYVLTLLSKSRARYEAEKPKPCIARIAEMRPGRRL